MEVTGGLESDAGERLHYAGMQVSVVNPRPTHAFARATGELAKTYEIAMKMLSHLEATE